MTGQNWGLSGLFYIFGPSSWPALRCPLFWALGDCHQAVSLTSQTNWNLFSVSPKIFVQVNISRSPYLGQEGQNTNVQRQTEFANFIDEWSQFDFCFTNFGVTLEYLESSITTEKAIFRLSSKVSWHAYTIVRDTRSSCGGLLTWKAQIHGSIHPAFIDSNLPPSCFIMQYNSLISITRAIIGQLSYYGSCDDLIIRFTTFPINANCICCEKGTV